MSETWRKSHNISVLIYHYVCPAKYRRVVFKTEVEEVLREVCLEIEKRYEKKFIEIGTDKGHVHFLIQSVPITDVQCNEDSANGEESDSERDIEKGTRREETIRKYVQEQGKEEEYKRIHRDGQLKLF